MQTISFDQYSVKHVSLSKFVAFHVISGARNNKWNRTVAMPSQAFLRKDGTLTIQSRKSNTGFKGYPLVKSDRMFGLLPTGESVEVKFS